MLCTEEGKISIILIAVQFLKVMLFWSVFLERQTENKQQLHEHVHNCLGALSPGPFFLWPWVYLPKVYMSHRAGYRVVLNGFLYNPPKKVCIGVHQTKSM